MSIPEKRIRKKIQDIFSDDYLPIHIEEDLVKLFKSESKWSVDKPKCKTGVVVFQVQPKRGENAFIKGNYSYEFSKKTISPEEWNSMIDSIVEYWNSGVNSKWPISRQRVTILNIIWVGK